MAIKLVISDNDGCFGDFPKFGRPHEEKLDPHIGNFDRIRDFLASYGVLFAMNTGRSLTNSVKIISELGMNAPCALEMGAVIYDPRTDKSIVSAYDTEDFRHLREAQDEVRRFRDLAEKANGSLNERLGCSVRLLKDRKNVVSLEIDGKSGYELASEVTELMGPEMRSHAEKGRIWLVPSGGAVDIMPAIGKRGATRYIQKLCRASYDETLAIGDSGHTDMGMMREARYKGCPGNADFQIKQYASSDGKDAYVTLLRFADGVFDILTYAAREWGFDGSRTS